MTSQLKDIRKVLPKILRFSLILVAFLFFFGSCKKDSTVSSDSLYVPTAANVTPSATLQELQEGRDLYISNCNRCHGLYLPESNSPSEWKSIMMGMGPKTGLPSSDLMLITKYLCKGMQ